jgi:hypothetical protein
LVYFELIAGSIFQQDHQTERIAPDVEGWQSTKILGNPVPKNLLS